MSDEQEKSRNVEAKQKISKDIITRVRKLRWAGMDEEAERLLRELEPQPVAGVVAEGVLPTRVETD